MSEENNMVETKYFEKLNISVLNIAEVKEVIKLDIKNTLNAWNKGRDVLKQCFRIIGAAGIGKTEICRQIVNELTTELDTYFGLIIVKGPVLLKDDFLLPIPVKSNSEIDIVDSYKMLYSDFVPKNKDSYGIFVIDEFARADHALQQLFWQIQDEYKVHQHEFPKGWFVISTDNPDDSEYRMDILEDAAGLRRQLHLYAQVSPRIFLDYAIQEDFHPMVIDFIQAHPDYVYDFEAQKKGSVYANPASWRKLSDHLWKYTYGGGILENIKIIELLSAGLINLSMAQIFMDFVKEREKQIQPKDLFYDYDKIRYKVLKMIEEGDTSRVSSLLTSFCTYLSTSRPKYNDKELNNIAELLSDIPVDMAAIFNTFVDTLPKEGKAFSYFQEINCTLISTNKKYKENFYEKAINLNEQKED